MYSKGINKEKEATRGCYRPYGTVTLAVKANLGPAKLPDIRASFATVSFHTSHVASCPPAPPLRNRRIFRHGGEWRVQEGEISRVNYFAAAATLSVYQSACSRNSPIALGSRVCFRRFFECAASVRIRDVQWAKITHTEQSSVFVDGLRSTYIDSVPIAACGVALRALSNARHVAACSPWGERGFAKTCRR
jgi:hypothetical protein